MAPRHQDRSTNAARLTVGLVLTAVGVLSGCSTPEPRYGWHGRDPVLAAYQSGGLHAELPREVPVQSAIAAGEMALERRGYIITATEATDDRGRVVARPADARLLRKITITSRLTQTGTAVTVRTDPGGHEHISRDILERMLTRLGM